MRGKRTGLVVRLQNDIPDLLSVHCVAHDLQLAILDASHDLDYMTNTFDPTLKKLFNFYHYSGRCTRDLEKAAAELNLTKELKRLPQWKSLRWAACEQQLVEAIIAD